MPVQIAIPKMTFPQTATVLSNWVTVLADLANTARLNWQRREIVLVSEEEGRLKIRSGGRTAGQLLADVAVGVPIADTNMLRHSLIRFVVSDAMIVRRRLAVPAQAREFLSGVIANRIERLSPWPVAQVYYGFDAKVESNDAGMLEIVVFIIPRAQIDAARALLTASGLSPDQIGLNVTAAEEMRFIPLWTRSSDADAAAARDLPRRIGMALAAFVAISVAISSWAIYSTSDLSARNSEIALRIDDLRRAEIAARRPRSLAALPPAERAWAMKEDSPVVVLILEALSRAVPDNAYLTELRFENEELRLTGLAADPPALIATLSRAKAFTDVRFFSPTLKSEHAGLYEFSISAHIAQSDLNGGI
jgi:general secretion pathway protein L